MSMMYIYIYIGMMLHPADQSDPSVDCMSAGIGFENSRQGQERERERGEHARTHTNILM